MQSIRIVTAGAFVSIVLFVSGTVTGNATAQTATNGTPGKPLQLLKIVEHPGKARPKPHAKVLARSSAKRAVKIAARRKTYIHIAAAEQRRLHLPVEPASAPPPDDISPTAGAIAPVEAAVAAATPQPVAAQTEPAPSEVVVAGQTVQVASPDDVNEIDLAANDATASAGGAAPASAPPMREITEAEPKTNSLRAAEVQQTENEVGSTSWILQVMAALGGAVAAGSAAWFLIGSTPQRMYG